MISIAQSLSPTRIIGLTADLFALSSCAVAWVRGRRAHLRTRLAATLTLLEAALLLDLAFNARWLLHNLLANVAIASHLYGERSGPQQVALGLLGFVVVAAIASALWRFRRRPGAALAACGGILSVCCWWVEVISLHAVDSVLYRRVDGVTFIRLAWAACSLMTGVGILGDTFAVQTRERPIKKPSASLTT